MQQAWAELMGNPRYNAIKDWTQSDIQAATSSLTTAQLLELYKLLYEWPSDSPPPDQGSTSNSLKALESEIQSHGDVIVEDLTILRNLQIRVKQMLAVASILSKANVQLPSDVKLNLNLFTSLATGV